MKKILIIGSDEKLKNDIEKIAEAGAFQQEADSFTLIFENDPKVALELLFYESVDVTILNFTAEEIPMPEVLAKINEDLWLCNGSLVAIHNEANEDEFLAKVAHNNIISVIPAKYIKNRLPNVLEIVLKNQNLIFQREVPVDLESSLRGRFVLDNDPFDVTVYASIISLYLFNANLIDIDGKSALKTALVEMLMNAIEHGNCDINFEEKSQSLLEGKTIFELIEEKNKNPEISAKKILLDFSISRSESRFVIEDEGPGFDWRKRQKLLDDDANAVLASGRGIFITTQSVSRIEYNEKGNRVAFTIVHQTNKSNLRPKIFQDKEEVQYREGEIVFESGELSNYLSYIVTGRFNVFDASGNYLATLTPQDIFIGEMAFLLGNRRTATVQAEEASTIIKLSKNEFMERIQQYPYYGLFLARLLAQRIVQLNQNRILVTQVKTVEKFIAEARQLCKEKQYRSASNLLRMASFYHPQNAEILLLLQNTLVRNKKYAEAITLQNSLQKLSLSKHDDFQSKILSGFSHYKQGQFEPAEQCYLQAQDIDAGNADLQLNFYRLYDRMGQEQKRQKHLSILKEKFASHPLVERL